jgi:hypothetical protein
MGDIDGSHPSIDPSPAREHSIPSLGRTQNSSAYFDPVYGDIGVFSCSSSGNCKVLRDLDGIERQWL